MRTTIDIPEDLLRQVKATAALRGQPLKEIVREALQRLLSEPRREVGSDAANTVSRQRLAANCTFPLVIGETGPAMRELKGGDAQKLLDEEELGRVADSR